MTGEQPGPRQTRRGLVGILLDRFGHLVREMSKFATVGGFAFLIDFALFNYLTSSRGVEELTAKTISTVIAASVAFIGNRFWTWRHRQRNNPAREYALFFFFNAVGLGIAVACLALSRYGLGSHLAGRVPDASGRQRRQLHRRHGARHAVPILVVPAVRLRRSGNPDPSAGESRP